MAQGSFSAAVDAWTRATRERMEAVRKEAIQRTIEVMQTPRAKGGALRVDTGFLRASLMAAVGSANFAVRDRPDGDASYNWNASQVTLVIAQAQLEQPIEVVYTAAYARAREYGARGQPGDRWVALAAQQWPRIVEETIRDAKAAVASR